MCVWVWRCCKTIKIKKNKYLYNKLNTKMPTKQMRFVAGKTKNILSNAHFFLKFLQKYFLKKILCSLIVDKKRNEFNSVLIVLSISFFFSLSLSLTFS